VVTSVEFERLLSGTGPTGGRLARPGDGGEVRKIAGCNASVPGRQEKRRLLSSFCCMASIKEALLASGPWARTGKDHLLHGHAHLRPGLRTATAGRPKPFHGVRFIRFRPHTIIPDPERPEGG
jgi:heterodisulfide reductase subunit A